MRASSCRSTPCTSSVHAGRRAAAAPPRERTVPHASAARAHDQPRLDVVARRPARTAARHRPASTPGPAARTSSGFFCQWRCMKAEAETAAEQAPGAVEVHGSVCDDRFYAHDIPCVVSLTWLLADAQGVEIDELSDPVEFFFGGDDRSPRSRRLWSVRRPATTRRFTSSPSTPSASTTRTWCSSKSARSFPKGSTSACSSKGRRREPKTTRQPGDVLYTVTEVYPDHVVLYGNHPLAGIALRLGTGRSRRARGE